MFHNYRAGIFPVLLISCMLVLGCTGITATPLSSPASPAVTTVSVTDSGNDLTNQNSPQAAIFKNGASTTVLGPDKPGIRLQSVVSGLSAPMMMAVLPGGSGRMAVVEQTGLVKLVGPDATVMAVPFLDLRDRMVRLDTGYDERGLLSLAFHPGFPDNGRVFVFYSAPLRPAGPPGWSCTNRLSEFALMAGNPDLVDPASEKVLLTIDQPYSNHNGGPLLFGPDDGYLYLALGDGGRSDDTGTGHTPGIGNAQDPLNLHGKILRIDVDSPPVGEKMYAVPPDNPFAGVPGYAPEIYAMGFRNPAYAAFDRGGNHSLVVASAGQKLFEAAYIVDKGGNYGWNIREGTHCFNPADNSRPPAGPCPATGAHGEPLIGPIIETGHDVGNTIVGGFVYRGAALPDLAGKYVFGQWSTSFGRADGTLLVSAPPAGYDIGMYPSAAGAITPRDNRMWTTQEFRIAGNPDGRLHAYVRGFGEDGDHELYVLTSTTAGPDPAAATGAIAKLVPG